MKTEGVIAINIKKIKGDWSSVDYVDKSTGRFHRIYKYKDKACKSVYLKSRLSQHLAGYSLIEKDLRSSLIWLKEIKCIVGDIDAKKDGNFKISRDRETFNIVKGLFVAALTFYGKGFTKCDGRPVKLERIQIEEKFRDLHDLAISYRNNFAAHSGSVGLETANIALVVPVKVKVGRPVPMNLYTEINQPDLAWHNKDNDLWFIELLEHVQLLVRDKIKKLRNKIMEEVGPKDLKEFFK
ncbi:hypothetical protein ACW9I6_21875 [Pseudomonas sp. SDO5522_S412]